MPKDNTPRGERSEQHDEPNRRRVLKGAAVGAASMVGVAGTAAAGSDGAETESGCCLACRDYFCCGDGVCDELCYTCTCTCDGGGLQ